ncbi:MAG: hypothetical protein J0I49_30095 [Pseudonocardia sp.]|uniref:hypothetical protein n=1 Tax=Pseudonocardia sp. TaxID=60912 RepID=UPI001AD5B1D0|nr:hypothetical protein [Pseudonocardia sp.]MBN9102317.1 hypothetical protein [Pseudonocardia sp.]
MIEYRLIMAVLTMLCAIAPLTIFWPVIDVIMTSLVAGAVLAGFLGYWFREAWRELRFRRDMRAFDVRDAERALQIEQLPSIGEAA